MTTATAPLRGPRPRARRAGMPVAERAVLAIMLLPALAVLVPFFLLPMAVLVRNSIWIQQAPGLLLPGFSLDTYLRVLTDLFYLEMFANTFGVSLAVTLLTVLIGYPFAYFIVRRSGRWRAALIWCLYLPLLVSVIARVFGWIVITADSGLINATLLGLGVVEEPVRILYAPSGMLLGMTHRYLPIMVLPIAAAIVKSDPALIRASRDLGSGPMATFFRVELPLSLPGIVAGAQLVFAAVLSDFVLPLLLGSTRFRMLAPAIYDEAVGRMNWGHAAAIACLGVAVMAIVLMASNIVVRRLAPWARSL